MQMIIVFVYFILFVVQMIKRKSMGSIKKVGGEREGEANDNDNANDKVLSVFLFFNSFL